GFNEYWRTFWLGRFEGRPWAQVAVANRTLGYLLLGGGYLLLVLCIAGRTLWRRRLSTVLYNVDTGTFEATLVQTMEGLGLRWIRSGNLICWTPTEPLPDSETEWEDGASGNSDTSIQAELGPTGGKQTQKAPSVARSPLPSTHEDLTQSLQLEVNPSLCYVC